VELRAVSALCYRQQRIVQHPDAIPALRFSFRSTLSLMPCVDVLSQQLCFIFAPPFQKSMILVTQKRCAGHDCH